MLKYADRVQESVSNKPDAATAYNLAGAVSGHQTFVAGIGDANTCVYCAQQVDAGGAPNGAWEVGVGLIAAGSPDTLARSALIASSSGAKIDWSPTGVDASPRVFVVSPAAYFGSRSGYGPGHESGRWFGPSIAAALTTINPTANQVRVALMPWTVGVPINNIGIEVTAGVPSSSGRLGIYEDAGGLPGRLLVDAGQIDTSSAGIKTIALGASVYPLVPWLWLAYVCNGSAGIRVRTASNNLYSNLLGWDTAGSTTQAGGLYVLDVNAVPNGLSDPFGTPTFAADNLLPEVRVKA